VTTFFAVRMDKPVKGKKVICCCGFCAGGEQRKDVEHYKLLPHFDQQREYYMHICKSEKLVEIKEKL